jgi:hypothetical protein
MITENEIDVCGLVEDGFLDLNSVFSRSDWERVEGIATYTSCVFGANGDEPGDVEISLESATEYGITAYRWAEHDDGGTHNTGTITLDRDEAVTGGEEYAEENDETPDVEELLDKIVETGYFGTADADDIRVICEEATTHSQGYLLLPKGEFCGHPVGRLWTTNGYLQCEEYITLNATYSNISYAADALLRQVVLEKNN